MAIAKINKIEIIGIEKDREALLRLLQKLSLVQLLSLRTQDIEAAAAVSYSETNLLAIAEAIEYLASCKEKNKLLGSIVSIKPVVYERRLKETIAEFDYQGIVKELSMLKGQLKNIFQDKERLIQERQLLLPWRDLSLSLDELHYEHHCVIILGLLNHRDYQNFLRDLEKEKINLFIEIVHQDQACLYLGVIYLKEDFERLDTFLRNYHFNTVTIPRHKGTAKERLSEISREILLLEDEAEEVKSRLFSLSKHQFKLMMVYDYLYNINEAQKAEQNLARQKFTFAVSGWVRQKDVRLLTQELKRHFKEAAIFISQAQADEAVPVTLENRRIFQPFEFITAIYGMPKYNEIDPTPFLAPFFFLYFGFCLSDVCYGLLLALVSFWVLKKFKMGPQGVKFFRLFLFCGISTIIIGALTGSWFGNLFDILSESNKIFLPLKKFKDSIIILDPFQQPTKLLGIALSFGIIQVWFGNIVAAIGNIKNKRYLDIALDQLPMLTFLFGLTGLGLIFLQLLDKINTNLFKYSALIGATALLLTQGRSEKGIGSKLFYGAYNLYNAISGYLSDILSYSRLWALGLVTGVMARTVNLIAVQFSQILPSVIPFINKIGVIKVFISGLMLVVIFVLGHTISLLMNLLGAFVHPLRLQFVEFFSKFFKSGGSAFKPFGVRTKYINISEK